MKDYGYRENEERKNYERNAGLREHRRKIGNGERLPEQDAAIATLAVQRVERVEETDDEGGREEQPDKVTVRHGYHHLLMAGVHARECTQGARQKNQIDEEGEHPEGRGGQRCDVDRTVLPEFAADRPIQRPSWG